MLYLYYYKIIFNKLYLTNYIIFLYKLIFLNNQN